MATIDSTPCNVIVEYFTLEFLLIAMNIRIMGIKLSQLLLLLPLLLLLMVLRQASAVFRLALLM